MQTINKNSLNFIANKKHNAVLVIGCVHGDEPQGKFLIEEYWQVLQLHNPLQDTFSEAQYKPLLHKY